MVPCIPLYPYSDRRTYRYRRISMSGHMAIRISGGIIAFPIRVCHGLDSDILDKLLTWWYRNKKKSVIMAFTRVREATSFYCRTSGIVSSMCEKEFFLSSQRFFHIPKGGAWIQTRFSFLFPPHMTQNDYPWLFLPVVLASHVFLNILPAEVIPMWRWWRALVST